MASKPYVQTLLGGTDPNTKRSLTQVFDYVLSNLRLGRPTDRGSSENLRAYFYTATTPAVASQEFSIRHGLGAAPYLAVPVLPLDVGARTVPLLVTRAPDAERIYLSSSETNAPVCLLVEG